MEAPERSGERGRTLPNLRATPLLVTLNDRGRSDWARRLGEAFGPDRMSPEDRVAFVVAVGQEGDPARTRLAAETVAAGAEDAMERAIVQARVLGEAGLLDDAGEVCDNALARFPDEPRLHVARGDVAATAGDHERGYTEGRWLTERQPDRADHWYRLGVSCRRIGLLDEATAALARAAEIAPADIDVRTATLEVQLRRGDRQAAHAALAPPLDPDVAAGWRVLVVSALEPVERASGVSAGQPPAPGSLGPYAGWTGAIAARANADAAGVTTTLKTVFGDGADRHWPALLAVGATIEAAERLDREGDLAGLARALDVIVEALDWDDALVLPRALVSLPRDQRPYARLAVEERRAAFAFLYHAGRRGRDIALALPDAPDHAPWQFGVPIAIP